MNRDSTSATAVLPPTARGQKTRAKLVRAAEHVFAQKHFEDASIADITRRAGVALGTFYVYFPDKTALYVELVDELGGRLRRQIAEAVAGLPDRLAVERQGYRTFLDFTLEHPGLYRIVRQAEFVDLPCYQRYYARLTEGYVEGLRAAMARGELRALDPELAAYCLMGIADFLGLRWGRLKTERERERALDTVMDFVTRGLGPPAGAAPARPAAAPRRRT